MFEREVERALLLGEIPSDRGQGFGVLGELPGERAGVGLGGGGNPPERRHLRGDGAERLLEFVDPRGEPALNGVKPVAGRSDRPIDDGAGLAEIVDHQRQFVAQPVAGAGERLDRVFRAAGDGVAERGAGRLDLLGQPLQQPVDRLGRAVGRVGGDAAQRFAGIRPLPSAIVR